MADPALLLADRFAAAIVAAFGDDLAGTDPVIRRSQQPQFGDYQANVAMSLGKRVGRPPRDVANEIVAHLDRAGVLAHVEVAGPGFVNITLDAEAIAAALTEAATTDRAGVPVTSNPERVIIDYSSPNVAKEMHVGHLRSTIIGDALVRVLTFLGHDVVRQNHLGDWGTQFGMLIEHLVDRGWDRSADHSISDLNALYQEASRRFNSDPDFADRARRRVVELQGGDKDTLALWHQLVAESVRHMEEVYARLGVLLTEDDIRGESYFNPMLPGVVSELEAKGLTVVDDGALCVFPEGFRRKDGEPLPMIVRKSDGGFGYDATDLAGLRFRIDDLEGQRVVYVVGAPQSQHFAMLFAVASMVGWLDRARAEHVAFGNILGEDGKPFKTRSGENVRLVELLEEAETRSAAVVEQRSDLDAAARAAVAHAVGIGAVKYADLSNDRVKDYVFSWDRMLAMEGNTAPYLQYAHARIQSIFRRAEVSSDGSITTFDASAVEHPAERALALQLLSLPAVVEAVAESLQPHRLCTYLFETAQAFTTFYEQCPVLRADNERQRTNRLGLCKLTAQVLAVGLGLLGIDAPDRM